RQRTRHERLARIVFIDYDREMALVAARHNPKADEQEIAGVGRITKSHSQQEAEFGIIISDRYQGQGIGRELLQRLIQVGRDENLQQITGYILSDNTGMLNLAKTLGFDFRTNEEGVVEATLVL
ncbi:MAG: GNAT family N-acetyltransferase, partial [Chloroflexota bacterium]